MVVEIFEVVVGGFRSFHAWVLTLSQKWLYVTVASFLFLK